MLCALFAWNHCVYLNGLTEVKTHFFMAFQQKPSFSNVYLLGLER